MTVNFHSDIFIFVHNYFGISFIKQVINKLIFIMIGLFTINIIIIVIIYIITDIIKYLIS